MQSIDLLNAVITTHPDLVPQAIPNPLDGILPDFTVFGAKFTALWQKLLGGLWALAILAAIAYLIRGLLGIAQHRGGGHPSQVAESRKEATMALASLGSLAALAVIVGVVLTLVS